jgi:hypothetical protein
VRLATGPWLTNRWCTDSLIMKLRGMAGDDRSRALLDRAERLDDGLGDRGEPLVDCGIVVTEARPALDRAAGTWAAARMRKIERARST